LTAKAWETPDVSGEGVGVDPFLTKTITESIDLVKHGMDGTSYQNLRGSLEHLSFPGKEGFVDGLEDLHGFKNSPELVSSEILNQKAESVLREACEAIGLSQREQSISSVRLEDAQAFVSRHNSPSLGLKNFLRQVELRQKTTSGKLRNGFFYDLEQQELVNVFKNKDHHIDNCP